MRSVGTWHRWFSRLKSIWQQRSVPNMIRICLSSCKNQPPCWNRACLSYSDCIETVWQEQLQMSTHSSNKSLLYAGIMLRLQLRLLVKQVRTRQSIQWEEILSAISPWLIAEVTKSYGTWHWWYVEKKWVLAAPCDSQPPWITRYDCPVRPRVMKLGYSYDW